MTRDEARYLRASRNAHQAWAESQPQYVIPGVLSDSPALAMLSGALEDTDPSAHLRVGVLERATAQPPLDGTRSTLAAPNHTRTKALTACSRRVDPAQLPLGAGSSVPHHNNEAGGSR